MKKKKNIKAPTHDIRYKIKHLWSNQNAKLLGLSRGPLEILYAVEIARYKEKIN